MPEVNVPVVGDEVETINFGAASGRSTKYDWADACDDRSCSPKSESSGCSESCDSCTDSDVSCQSEECLDEEAVHDDCADLAEGVSKMNMSEEEVSAMVQLGADVRHVVQSTWKLQNKDKAPKRANTRVVPGQSLRDMAATQKEAMELHEKRKSVKPPPGFEQMYGESPVTESAQEPIAVAYADGNSTFTLSAEPLCLHNMTVSSCVDAGHIFIKQMNNPTHVGLAPLEEAMLEAYQGDLPQLLRPIAAGSLLAVKSDGKVYRCQVVKFNEDSDSCDIKFVDHGGYTTVPVEGLCQLREDFIRLPFQAIEVYLAHVLPASDEIIIDIVSDILFRDDVSIQLVGYAAEDNVPIVQAFFYVNDYVHLLSQEVVDEAYTLFKKQFPDYVPVPVETTAPLQLELAESEISAEDAECAAHSDYSDEGICSGVSSTASEPRTAVHTPVSGGDDIESCSPVESTSGSPVPSSAYPESAAVPVIPLPVAYPLCTGANGEPLLAQPTATGEITYVPMYTYCVQDPNTGLLYYITAPAVAPVNVEFNGSPAAAISEEGQVAADENTCEEHTAECAVHSLNSKPIEEWTQEDYMNYYNQE